MTLPAAINSSVWFAGCLIAITAAAWWWRATVFHTHREPPAEAPWQHVQERYQLPQEPAEAEKLSPEALEAILAANPFSPDRRSKPASGVSSGGTAATAAVPAAPKFVYKGLVKLGNRQRAIVEDVTSRKTHFLEVGQEVAGFKVLDIAENRVVLSDPKTKEEIVVSVASKASP